jgi:hypothetical protein
MLQVGLSAVSLRVKIFVFFVVFLWQWDVRIAEVLTRVHGTVVMWCVSSAGMGRSIPGNGLDIQNMRIGQTLVKLHCIL